MSVLLSDDEAVALAARAGVRWSVPLPTVDIADDQALAAALARGARSLRLRGLVTGDADEAEVPEEFDGLLRAAGRVPNATLVVFREGAQADPVGGLAFGVALGDGAVLVDVVTPSGVHDFALVSADAAIDALSGFLKKLQSDGLVSTSGAASAVAQLLVGEQTVEVHQGVVSIAGETVGSDWAAVEPQVHALLEQAVAGETSPDR